MVCEADVKNMMDMQRKAHTAKREEEARKARKVYIEKIEKYAVDIHRSYAVASEIAGLTPLDVKEVVASEQGVEVGDISWGWEGINTLDLAVESAFEICELVEKEAVKRNI
jgi:predicted HTH domain antitoxin